MRGPEKLLQNESTWHTFMGAWFPQQGRIVLRGKNLFKEFDNSPWMGLLLYGITGRIPSPAQIRLFEGIWTLCTSYPDPRLWNNRVAALAGASRSTASLAINAANAISEASIYGHRPIIRSIDFLMRTKQQTDQGHDLATLVETELRKHRSIAGYGRPLTKRDERIEPTMALARKLGFSNGPYVTLAFLLPPASNRAYSSR